MNLIKRIVSGITELFDASVGRGTGDFQKGLTGAIALFCIVVVFWMFLLLLNKTSVSGAKIIVLSIIFTTLAVFIFAICAIIIEKIW